MRRWLIIGLLFFAAFYFSCSNKSNGSGGGGGDDGNPINNPGSDIKVSPPKTIDNADIASGAISLAAVPGGRWAVAYYRESYQGKCTKQSTAGQSTDVNLTSVFYATFDDTANNPAKKEVTQSDSTKLKATFLSGISLVFKNKLPFIAYLGGTESVQCCSGSDLMQASFNGTSWDINTIVVFSSDALDQTANCDVNPYCTSGDMVGLWPSQAVALNGTIGIVYQDEHVCYNLDDIAMADVEWAHKKDESNYTINWIDLGRGGGLYNRLVFDNQNNAAVAFYNGKENTINFSLGQLNQTDGSYKWPWDKCLAGNTCSNSDYTCQGVRCGVVVASNLNGLPEGSLSLTVDTNNHYLLAYFDSDTKHLMFAYSENGTKWQSAPIDSGSSTGKFPNILVNPITNKPVIVYYNCSADQNVSNCNYNQDGVRLAVFVGTYPGDLLAPSNWKKYNLDSDLDKTAWDGEFVSAAIQADGTIGLVYLYRPVSSGVTTLDFRTITLKQ